MDLFAWSVIGAAVLIAVALIITAYLTRGD